MKRYITLFLLFILCGCATTAANQAKVRIDDGLNAWEAKVIAQTDLNNSQFKEAYSWPKVLNNGMTDVHPEYWFVSLALPTLNVHSGAIWS